jgi:hypothetical protein
VLAALGFDPVSLDALSARTGMDAATLQARLLNWNSTAIGAAAGRPFPAHRNCLIAGPTSWAGCGFSVLDWGHV